MIFECAVTPESQERLLSDDEEKYFNVDTKIMVWVGLTVKLNANQDSGDIWLRWGRCRMIGWHLRVEEKTGVIIYIFADSRSKSFNWRSYYFIGSVCITVPG
jgi:hypothetical protein